MPSKLCQIVIYTKDLGKAQDFYDILGVTWGELGKEEIGPSGLPKTVETSKEWLHKGLPHLMGDLDDVQLYFYLDRNFDGDRTKFGTMFNIKVGDPQRIVDKLKAEGLFAEAPGIWFGVLDPDGRPIMLDF